MQKDDARVADPLASYEKFDGVGPHSETIETRARIGERYLEAYEGALSDPRLAGYCPADCPSELLVDLLHSDLLEAASVATLQRKLEVAREALECLQGAGKSGTWAEAVNPLVARFDVAAKFGHDAVHNSEGSYGLAELLRNMASKLDGAAVTARAALATIGEGGER